MAVHRRHQRDRQLEDPHHRRLEPEDERAHPDTIEIDQRRQIEAGAEGGPLPRDHGRPRVAELSEERLQPIQERRPDRVRFSVLQPDQGDLAIAFDAHVTYLSRSSLLRHSR